VLRANATRLSESSHLAARQVREREGVCEREREGVCERDNVCEREREGVCEREREGVCERDNVCERERVINNESNTLCEV